MKRTVAKVGDYVLKVQIVPLEEGGFLATCPDLPGCLAQGETVLATLDYVTDVAKKMLELMQEDGVVILEALKRHQKRKPLKHEVLVSLGQS